MSKTKYLWLISQDQNGGYDTFSDAVVCAETEQEAREIHPSAYEDRINWWTEDEDQYRSDTWASHPDKVLAKKIGIVTPDVDDNIELGAVICSSFHAG